MQIEIEKWGKATALVARFVEGRHEDACVRAIQRLLALGRRRRMDRELDDEILAHLELAERDAIRSGLSPEEARREARRRFGGVEQMKEEHRDQRSAQWIENLTRDIRHGFALLARDRGFTFVAVGILALGIGANTAMFSLVDAVLLKPMPVPGTGTHRPRLGGADARRRSIRRRPSTSASGSA